MSADAAILLREVGVALAGIVVGAAIVAGRAYWKRWRNTRQAIDAVVLWATFVVGAFAFFQGFTRALLLNADAPLDYRDWAAVALQINSLLFLVYTIRAEWRWRRGE